MLNPLVYSESQTVNLLPLLAYQKIYYDFFSESQWEKHLAYAYNVDYWDGKSQLLLAPDMLQLRYANYPKDYFMGMLPNSQYGSVAVLPGVYNPMGSSNSVVSVGEPNVDYVVNPASSTSVVMDVVINAGMKFREKQLVNIYDIFVTLVVLNKGTDCSE